MHKLLSVSSEELMKGDEEDDDEVDGINFDFMDIGGEGKILNTELSYESEGIDLLTCKVMVILTVIMNLIIVIITVKVYR